MSFTVVRHVRQSPVTLDRGVLCSGMKSGSVEKVHNGVTRKKQLVAPTKMAYMPPYKTDAQAMGTDPEKP